MKEKLLKLTKVIYALSFIVVFSFVLPFEIKTIGKIEKNVPILIQNKKYNSVPKDVSDKLILATFVGELTGYGPDCPKCIGITAGGHDARNGNIYYYDKEYGKVRIVASSRKYKMGTILRINSKRISSKPFYAIILDRGVSGNVIDLLFPTQDEARFVGRQKNLTFEIMRIGR
ncbi:MAG: hypothetical protein WCX15_00600 [Bacilli bacterium]|jgi:3D (Asp-Asp-Asp) domain-containing protein